MKTKDINIQETLRRYHLSPKKGLGQNFLTDDSVLERIAEISQADDFDAMLEIGPGLGSLTHYLAERSPLVVAVELDGQMIPILKETLSGADQVQIIQGDILEFDPSQYFSGKVYGVAANIPYYITSALIRHLLESTARPKKMTLTVQKEVAERICANDGKQSLLSLSAQIYGKPSFAFMIPAEAFYPAPDVDSAVVTIDLYSESLVSSEKMDDFFKLAKAGFGQKRKTLRNSLSSNLSLDPKTVEKSLIDAEIDPMRRAESLSVSDWLTLMDQFNFD